MRKIEKLALRKIVEPSDILKKKQMGNLWGGKEEDTCAWCCTGDQQGNCASWTYFESSCDECWRAAEFFCTYPTYGIWIQCK